MLGSIDQIVASIHHMDQMVAVANIHQMEILGSIDQIVASIRHMDQMVAVANIHQMEMLGSIDRILCRSQLEPTWMLKQQA